MKKECIHTYEYKIVEYMNKQKDCYIKIVLRVCKLCEKEEVIREEESKLSSAPFVFYP